MNLLGRLPRRRRFLLVASAIFLGLYGGVLALQWSFLRGEAIDDAERNARALTRLLAMEIEATAPLQQMLEHLDEPGRLQALDHLLRGKLAKFGVEKIKIYDREGTVLYADDPRLIGKRFGHVTLFQKALGGATVSRVITSEHYAERYGVSTDRPLVETYMPLQGSNPGAPRFVFEGYQNFSSALARMWRTLILSGLSLIPVIGLALGALTLAYRTIHRLEAHVETLEGLLPICASCKKIRVDTEGIPPRWLAVEQYFGDRDRLEFTHGMCPECLERFKAEIGRRKKG